MFDDAPTTAAGLIRLVRSEVGFTQSDLAAVAGVSQQAISAYETGRRDPTVESLQRLMEAAGYQLTVVPLPEGDLAAEPDRQKPRSGVKTGSAGSVSGSDVDAVPGSAK